jgi:hypothetical protein
MHIAEFKLKVKVHAPALQHVFLKQPSKVFRNVCFPAQRKASNRLIVNYKV